MITMKIYWLLFVIVFSVVRINYGYKILGIVPSMAKSHFIVGSSLMKGLAKRGHEVTVVSPFPLKTPLKNYRDIETPDVIEDTKPFMDNLIEHNEDGPFGYFQFFQMGVIMTNSTLNDRNLRPLFNSKEKFDLVIMEIFLNEALLGFGPLVNAPIVGYSTLGASARSSDMIGTPSPPSYVPNTFLSFTDHMTLFERIGNIIVTIADEVVYNYFYLPKQEELYNQHFPDPKPNFYELRKNVSLILLNNHFSVSFPRPYVPNMIEVGGMHVNRESKPLPADIKKVLDNAKHGVIYFSMGSNLKSKDLPKEKREAILNAFKSLEQQVLWKWEDKDLPGKSDNIFINDWFPQDDILAHPNVKLFITHGGLLSTTEAIYHGVPVVGIPMYADQFLNMARATRAGFGLTVNYKDLTTEGLQAAINEILGNKKYAENMKTMSDRYRDQPMNPLDTAIYWVEYVIRHKGAPHLHSAGQDLNLIAYYNIDVLAILGAGIFLVLYLLYAMIGKYLSLFKRKPKKTNEKQKKN